MGILQHFHQIFSLLLLGLLSGKLEYPEKTTDKSLKTLSHKVVLSTPHNLKV